MTGLFAPRRLLTITALTLAWCGLWREISPANLLAGLAIGVAVTALGVGTAGQGGIRIVPLIRLLTIVLVDLAQSTLQVATEIITPGDSTDEAVIAVELPPSARNHMLLLTVAVTLTPGTAVVDVDRVTSTIYLHLLHDSRRDETVEHVDRLARLAAEALPVGSSARTTA